MVLLSKEINLSCLESHMVDPVMASMTESFANLVPDYIDSKDVLQNIKDYINGDCEELCQTKSKSTNKKKILHINHNYLSDINSKEEIVSFVESLDTKYDYFIDFEEDYKDLCKWESICDGPRYSDPFGERLYVLSLKDPSSINEFYNEQEKMNTKLSRDEDYKELNLQVLLDTSHFFDFKSFINEHMEDLEEILSRFDELCPKDYIKDTQSAEYKCRNRHQHSIEDRIKEYKSSFEGGMNLNFRERKFLSLYYTNKLISFYKMESEVARNFLEIFERLQDEDSDYDKTCVFLNDYIETQREVMLYSKSNYKIYNEIALGFNVIYDLIDAFSESNGKPSYDKIYKYFRNVTKKEDKLLLIALALCLPLTYEETLRLFKIGKFKLVCFSKMDLVLMFIKQYMKDYQYKENYNAIPYIYKIFLNCSVK